MRKLAFLLVTVTRLAFPADVSKTERVDFPPGGTLRLQDSSGELTMEGWDQPAVEISTFVSPEAMKQLEGVHITAKQKGAEVVVSVIWPQRFVTWISPIQLPEDGTSAIDAKSKLGAIDSDLPGYPLRQPKFGHALFAPPSAPTQKVYLRIGFGDITIFTTRRPAVQQR
ncbi:MAG TPA: hypothetical protein VGN17_26690 [Bryobacteraceae bacterium]|jgi:hypothetical protein